MDVIDWLKSEKIEVMSSACVGAYIILLCEAWTRPCCSLPSATLALMKLARWTDTVEAFEPVLQCFEPLKGDRSRVVNPRLKREWDETSARVLALSEAGKRGAEIKKALHEKKPKPSKLAASTTDFEQFWQAYPKKIGKLAALQAWKKAVEKTTVVDILHAIDIAKKCEQWTKESGRFIPNPSTWLNQGRWSDQPLSNGHASQPHCDLCKKDYPDPAALKTHNFLYHPKYEG